MNSPGFFKAIGRRVRDARVRKGLTQEALAQMTEVSTSFVGHIERGEKAASMDTMARMCDALEVSLDHLVRGKAYACDQIRCPLYVEMKDVLMRYSLSGYDEKK
ncbi:MAG: helix-turn-helix transcriptional regulator [Clostridia bacterium]|nr:helix-turn-helix transcriptional regulator [Clostridia bacterium]